MAELPIENIPQDAELEESFTENSPFFDRWSEGSRDEFWDALSSNYDYLMDDGLIATCREASSDLSLDEESDALPDEDCCWTFGRFMEQFRWLHDLLHNLQVAREGDSTEQSQRICEEQQKVAYLCKLFNEQAQKLCRHHPDMRDEVNRRLNLLNNKWKASIHPKTPSKDAVFDEIASRMRNLRRWLRELEGRLCPLSSAQSWPLEKLEDKYEKQTALQKEIESRGKCVSVLLRLCERLQGSVRFGQGSIWDAERVRKVASNLEHRWHALWLNSLESQCIMEGLLSDARKGCEKLEKSFNEEPLKKYPRLSDSFEVIAMLENKLKNAMNARSEEAAAVSTTDNAAVDVVLHSAIKNDKAVMVGDTGIAALKATCAGGSGKFEIVQDVGYSSETSAHLSTDDKPDGADFHVKDACSASPPETTATESTARHSPMGYLAPDKYPSVSPRTLSILSEERSLQSSRNRGCRSVPDTFYKVACVDCDEEEATKPQEHGDNVEPSEQQMEPSEHTSTPKSHHPADRGRIKNLLRSIEAEGSSSKKGRRKASTIVRPNDLWRKSALVCEWLDKCSSVAAGASDDDVGSKGTITKGDWSLKGVNSSCDASGECTTEESDSEKSTSDVNNSVTFSQSFTGSVDTVVPATQEAVVDPPCSLEPSPCVRMRKKRRGATRDRPWSVIELNRAAFTSSTVPHSTSESALDLLCSTHDSTSGKALPKKLCPRNKRLSLTDISNLNCPSARLSMGRVPLGTSAFDRPIGRCNVESDMSSDNCRTLVCAADSTDSSMKFGSEKLVEVQVVLSESNSLPDTTISVDTDLPATEDQTSLSDQAWDEYQDPPYLSEPYSEQTVDEDEVRRLISFGDDYRATLGSYSDGSSVSLRPPARHRRTRTSLTKSNGGDTFRAASSDTNSDSEDFYHILKTSSHTLQFVSSSIKDGDKASSPSSKYAELVATCQTNLGLLKEIAAARCELESVSEKDVLKLQDLIGEWEKLLVRLLVLSRDVAPRGEEPDLVAETSDVQSSLARLRESLGILQEKAEEALRAASSLEPLDNSICELQGGLSSLQELKECILSTSAKILRLISEGGGPSLASYREDATRLYQLWEDVYELHCTQLTKLQLLKTRWGKSTWEELELETTVQWQPVQVGSSLPTAEVLLEPPHLSTAAEVQMSDLHDVLSEMAGESSSRCVLVEGELRKEPQQRSSVESEKKKKSFSSLRRVLCAAFPFQLLLLLLYCLSCYTDTPQCCENANNYAYALVPHLRYPHGPPPI